MAVNARPPRKLALDRTGAVLTLIGVVSTLRYRRPLRIAIVTLLMVSWVLFTNHCVLGMMQATGKTEHCCGGETGPQHEPPGGLRECCHVKATTALAQAQVKFDAAKFALRCLALVQVLVAPQTELQCTASVFDHGPPGSISFAESVLQRSLLSHAPPFAV